MKKSGKIVKVAAAALAGALAFAIIVRITPKKKEMPVLTEGQSAAQTVAAATESPQETADWEPVSETETQETASPALEKYKKLKEGEIPDLIGWLKIEGTNIDYPVVQGINSNDFYVRHDPYGAEDVYGSIFLEQVNDAEKPDNNMILYGHNRGRGHKDPKMFGELMEYKSENYYKEHPYIEFDTLYAEGRYEIISVFLSRVYYTTDTNFKYYQFFGSDDPKEFQNYVDNVKKLSLYEIEAGAAFGDELITLSTCEYTVENGRLAIVARKILP